MSTKLRGAIMALATPDITPAQVVALVAASVDLLVQFGVNLSSQQQTALIAFFGVLAAVVLADGHIRNGRARNAQEIAHSQDIA